MSIQATVSASFRQIAPRPTAYTNDPNSMPGLVTTDHSFPQARKRSQHPTACLPCRNRKSKCDGVRSGPCGACARRGNKCNYELGPGETRQGKLQKEKDFLRGKVEGHQAFFEVIRSSSETEAMDIFKTLRSSVSAKEAIEEVLASSILLKSNSASRSSSAAQAIGSGQPLPQPRYALGPIDLPATAGPPSFIYSATSSSPTATTSVTAISPIAVMSRPMPAPAIPYGSQLGSNTYDSVPRASYYNANDNNRLPSISALIPERYISTRGKMLAREHYDPRQT